MRDPFLRLKVYDERVLRVKGFIPRKTPWGRDGGRPIYDRLPAGSGSYQTENPEDVLVLVDNKNPNSLLVGAWQQSPSVLVIQSGILTWEYGQVPVNTYAVNISDLGLQDGDYQVGYYLNYEQVEELPETVINDDNISLSTSLCRFESSKAGIKTLFTEYEFQNSWETTEGKSEWFAIDFTQEVTPRNFGFLTELVSNRETNYSLYSSRDAIVWELENKGFLTNNVTNIAIPHQISRRYWKIYFSGGLAKLRSFSYSGEAIYPNTRPSGKVSVATPFLDNKYGELEQTGIVLAFITVRDGKIVEVADTRRITTQPYEPVSRWLTTFQDESLKKLFGNLTNYSRDFLTPIGSMQEIYRELLAEPNFRIQNYKEKALFVFPSRVNLNPPTTIVLDPNILTNGNQEIVTERTELNILGENVPVTVTNAVIAPSRIINLSHPELDDHIATKRFTDLTLDVPVDNGTYN